MKLTTKGRYALRAMLDLINNSNGSPVRLKEISDRQGISLHYLEQLFRKLRTGGIVNSVRGPGGGYILATSEDNISVSDILLSVGEILTYRSNNISFETAESNAIAGFFSSLDTTVQQELSKTLGEINTKK